MLNIGDQAPDFPFKLSGSATTLHQELGRGPVVLYFYPADFTPICSAQACGFRDAHAQLSEAGIRVIGVSPQSADSHDRFAATHKLPFTLVSDTDKAIAVLYGVTGPFGLGIRRVTYLIDPSNTIVDRTVADLRVSEHRKFIERVLRVAPRTPPASTPS